MRKYGWVIICSLLFLTGCWDIEESDRMDYIHAVGVDYEDGEIVIHLQIINLASIGIPEISAEADSNVTIATSSGDTVSSAIHDIYQSAQRQLYWGHDTVTILTDAALENGKLKEVIDILNRFPETRYRINMYATKDDMKELLKVSTIFQGTPILTRITDLDNTYEQSSLIQKTSIRELIIQLDEPGHNGIIPTISLTKGTWESESEPIDMIKDIGVAIVTTEEFGGFIVNDHVKGLRWTEDSKRNNVTVFQDGKPASEVIVVEPKQSYKIETENGRPTVHLQVKAQGIINEMLQDVDQDQIVKKLEKTIEEETMHTYKQGLELNSDIYRLSELLYRRDHQTWKKIEQDGMIPLDEESLKVEVDMKLVDSMLDTTRPTVDD